MYNNSNTIVGMPPKISATSPIPVQVSETNFWMHKSAFGPF